MKCLIISSVTTKSAITPSLSGLTADIFPGVLPSIVLASSPTAKTDFFPLSSIIATTDASCFGDDGTATVTVTGGTPPYAYQWNSGGMGGPTASGPVGIYQCNVMDANGCQVAATDTINEPTLLTAAISYTPIYCAGISQLLQLRQVEEHYHIHIYGMMDKQLKQHP